MFGDVHWESAGLDRPVSGPLGCVDEGSEQEPSNALTLVGRVAHVDASVGVVPGQDRVGQAAPGVVGAEM